MWQWRYWLLNVRRYSSSQQLCLYLTSHRFGPPSVHGKWGCVGQRGGRGVAGGVLHGSCLVPVGQDGSPEDRAEVLQTPVERGRTGGDTEWHDYGNPANSRGLGRHGPGHPGALEGFRSVGHASSHK